MTYIEFGQWATGYYGPWPEGMKADIRDWLTEKTPEHLDFLKAVCLEMVPSRIGQVNGYPPDVAKLIELAVETGRMMEAAERHTRELAYEAKALPAPENMTYSDIDKADWAEMFAATVKDLSAKKAFR